MIEQLKVSTNSVFLEGMSLVGAFNIHNPNNLLAINYQIQALWQQNKINDDSPDTIESLGSIMTIFPKSGVLLHGENQKVKIKLKSREQSQYQSFLASSVKLCLKYSVDNNFNKILIKNKKITNITLQQLAQHNNYFYLNVEIGTDHIRVKDQIEAQAFLSSTLGIASHQNQSMYQKDKDIFEVQDLIQSLQLNSKIKMEENGENFLKQIKQQQKSNINLQFFDVPSRTKFSKDDNFEISLKTVKAQQFSKDIHTNNHTNNNTNYYHTITSQKQSKINSLQLLILVIVSAFFFALGSNLSHFLKH